MSLREICGNKHLLFVKLPPPPLHVLHFSVPKVRPVDLSLNLAVKVFLTKDYCVLYPLKYMLIFPFIFSRKVSVLKVTNQHVKIMCFL